MSIKFIFLYFVEKDNLLLRNAELFQQLQSLQQSQQVEKMEYEQVLKEKSEIYAALKKEVEDNEVTLDQYRKQVGTSIMPCFVLYCCKATCCCSCWCLASVQPLLNNQPFRIKRLNFLSFCA